MECSNLDTLIELEEKKKDLARQKIVDINEYRGLKMRVAQLCDRHGMIVSGKLPKPTSPEGV